MYKIAICEDDALFAEYLSKEIQKCFHEQNKNIQINLFLNSHDLLKNNATFDLYFMDILLSDGNGIKISEKLQKRYGKLTIIFVSNNDASVFEAIHQSPFRFIRKDKLKEELPEACKSFLTQKAHSHIRRSLFVKQKATTITIPVESILYMETKGHYINFYCTDDTYHIRGSFKDYPELCEDKAFGRSSQSFLVHFEYVRKISSNEIILTNNERLPISRSKKKDFQEKYMHYQRLKHYGNNL